MPAPRYETVPDPVAETDLVLVRVQATAALAAALAMRERADHEA